MYNSARCGEVDTNRALIYKRKNTLVEECMLKSLKVVKKAKDSDDEVSYCPEKSPKVLRIKPAIQIQLKDEVDDVSIEIQHLENFETDPYLALGGFYSYIFATILEEVLQSMYILEECNNSMRICKAQQEMPVLLARKYGILPEEPNETEIEEMKQNDVKHTKVSNLESYSHKLNKMVNDRKTVINVMKETYKSLAVEQGFKSLWNHLKNVDEMKGREYLLEIDEGNNRMVARSLYRQKRHQCNQFKSAQYDVDGIIEKLQVQIEDADAMKELKCRYVDKWQGARTQQHQMAIRFEQDEQTNSTDYYKRRSELERIAHAEVDMFLNIAIHETLDKVEKAMETYETDLEAMNLKIQIQRSEYLSAFEERQVLEKTYKTHEKELNNWKDFKDKREQLRRYRERREQAAVTVQGWWRGIIVRQHLGPFRPAVVALNKERKKPKAKKK